MTFQALFLLFFRSDQHVHGETTTGYSKLFNPVDIRRSGNDTVADQISYKFYKRFKQFNSFIMASAAMLSFLLQIKKFLKILIHFLNLL